MSRTGRPARSYVDVEELLALRSKGVGFNKLRLHFRCCPNRLRAILAEHEDRPQKAHYPGQDGIMRGSGTSRLPPCPICKRRVHPREMKCAMCSVVMHPEWETPGPWWAHEKRCQDCAVRFALTLTVGKGEP